MGLAPSEFWALEYSELDLVLKGHQDRERHAAKMQREMGAWMLQWLLAPYTKKDEPLTMDMLLGRKPRQPVRRFASAAAAAQAFFAARDAQLKEERGDNG